MTKILYEFELLWLLSKAVANAAFRSNPTPQWWSECSARTMVPISTGTVQQNISLTGLLATVTQTTKEKCLQNSPLSPMLFMHQCPTKWQSQDRAASTISLSTRKPKFSLLCQKPKTWPQLQAPAHTVGEGTGGAHQPSLKAPSTGTAGTRHFSPVCSCTWVNVCCWLRTTASPCRTAHKHHWLQTQIDEA